MTSRVGIMLFRTQTTASNVSFIEYTYIDLEQVVLEKWYGYQAANLAGFRASEDPRFEAGIPDFMNGILNFSIHFNVVT